MRYWSQCFFESTLAHEHCTEAHTRNTADNPKDTGLLGTPITPVILRSYADDFKTAQQIACVSECEASVTTLSNYYFRSVAGVYSYHTSATVTTKVELRENQTVTRKKNQNQNKINSNLQLFTPTKHSVSDALVCTHTWVTLFRLGDGIPFFEKDPRRKIRFLKIGTSKFV